MPQRQLATDEIVSWRIPRPAYIRPPLAVTALGALHRLPRMVRISNLLSIADNETINMWR